MDIRALPELGYSKCRVYPKGTVKPLPGTSRACCEQLVKAAAGAELRTSQEEALEEADLSATTIL